MNSRTRKLHRVFNLHMKRLCANPHCRHSPNYHFNGTGDCAMCRCSRYRKPASKKRRRK
jgi:hypothetical protein